MKLTAESRRKLESVIGNLKRNIPLAGLLAGTAVLAGCNPSATTQNGAEAQSPQNNNANTPENISIEEPLGGDVVLMGELAAPEDIPTPPETENSGQTTENAAQDSQTAIPE